MKPSSMLPFGPHGRSRHALRDTLLPTVCFVVVGAFLLGLPDSVHAQTSPFPIGLQGLLVDTNDGPLGGSFELTFRIYDTTDGGTALWEETQQNVPVDDGLYGVALGLSAALPTDIFIEQPRYLEVSVNGEVLGPRIALHAVPMAATAGTLTEGALQAGSNVSITRQAGGALRIDADGGGGGGGLSSVAANTPITGDGTSGNPLGIEGGGITGALLADGAVSTAKLEERAVTGAKIGDGALLEGPNVSITRQGDGSLEIATGGGSEFSLPFSGTTSSDDAALSVENTGSGDGIQIKNAGNNGVYMGTVNTGVHIVETTFHGVDIATAGFVGVSVGSAGFDGVSIGSAGRHGLLVQQAADAGLRVDQANAGINIGTANGAGMVVGSAGNEGVRIISAGLDGFRVDEAANDGMLVQSAGRFGLNVVNAVRGVDVNTTSSDGVLVRNAGRHGLLVSSASSNGVQIDQAGNNGIQIGETTFDGLQIQSSGRDGIRISGAGESGINVSGTTVDGIHVGGAGRYGILANGNTAAGKFNGNVEVVGTLSKGGGSFKIDHPLDPANRYLQHSFVESPDMMNVYNGNAVLDAAGEAVVTLPDYFETLNRDFRYQLTCIGGFAPVYIAEKINGNQFRISGGTPGMEVSWQVTGIRQDAWANENRIVVEQDKKPEERGFYLHPKLYGQPETRNVVRLETSDPF